MAIVRNNSEFIFGFEAIMTNVNGDPDQENKPRMDYETMTALVSDARRKRDIRDFLKNKGYNIFVDVLADQKVPMDKMLAAVLKDFMSKPERIELIKAEQEFLRDNWLVDEKWADIYGELKKLAKEKKTKEQAAAFNNALFTEIIKQKLIDIRLFGSAMAVEGFSKTYTGAVQITWGYSLHPVDLVESNSITSIMNDDSSTFGKKYKLYYGHFAHYGTINKYAAKLTGMTEEDHQVFCKALVQSMHNNQTDSKQGQTPQYFLEIIYKPEFDGYLGDLRRFVTISDDKENVRRWSDIKVDFTELDAKIKIMQDKGFVEEVRAWIHPSVDIAQMIYFPEHKPIELLAPIL
ncbi:MAG TPA: CRISPR-associated protein [Clostridiales bacterium]|jgi:CRISPR-associated protein Csh2|nr:CRISPR-associated protein [Clostridiales bacterium]